MRVGNQRAMVCQQAAKKNHIHMHMTEKVREETGCTNRAGLLLQDLGMLHLCVGAGLGHCVQGSM